MNDSFIQGMAVCASCFIISHILSWLSETIYTFLKEYTEKRKEMKD